VKEHLTRYWLACAIALTVVLALLVPGPGLALPRYHVIDAGVVAVMFLGSLKLTPSRFRRAASRLDLVLLSTAMVFVVAPVVSLILAEAVGLGSGEDRLAVLVCTAQSSTLATAIVLTEVAGGDVALAMVITVVNNLLTAALTPLIFRLLGGAEIEVDLAAMASELALKIAAPVLVAQVARRWIGAWAQRRSRALSVASQIIILSYIYAGVAAAAERLSGEVGAIARVLALAVALHAAMLLVVAAAARVATRLPEQRAALVLCSSQKTLPAAILVWKSHFAALPIGPLVAVAYHMLQLVVDSLLAPGLLRLPLVRNAPGGAKAKDG